MLQRMTISTVLIGVICIQSKKLNTLQVYADHFIFYASDY